MTNIKFINNNNQISLSKEWVDSVSFKSKNRFLNEKCQVIGTDSVSAINEGQLGMQKMQKHNRAGRILQLI